MRVLLFAAMFCSLFMNTLIAQAVGPILSWDYAVADVAKVTRWELCIDRTCSDVTPSRQDSGDTAKFSHQFAFPLSPQNHTFSVKACNAVACVASDDLSVSVPTKPIGLALN